MILYYYYVVLLNIFLFKTILYIQCKLLESPGLGKMIPIKFNQYDPNEIIPDFGILFSWYLN